MANFIEEFIFGTPNAKTGESDGGIAGALDTIVPDPTNPIRTFLGVAAKVMPLSGAGAVTVSKGIEYLDTAVNYGLNRPTSTILQAVNAANPLYKDGLQWDDFRQMFNASEYLSVGRSLQTLQTTGATAGQYEINEQTGLNKFNYLSGYNPYPESGGMTADQVEKLWDDSILGTINSGLYDTGWNYVGGVKGVNLAGTGLKRAAGLATQVRGIRDLSKLSKTFDDAIKYAETNGAEGRRSVWGDHILDMANTKDWSRIYSNPMINGASKIVSTRQKELADLIQPLSDPRLIADIILADKGDVSAVGRLFQNSPDIVWSMTDMNQGMRVRLAEYGDKAFTAEEARRFNQSFDSHLARDEFYDTVKKIFTQTEHGWEPVDANTGLITNTTVNSTTLPMQGIAGKAQAWLYRQRELARNGTAGQWIDIRLGVAGKNAPATVLLQWVGGRKPLNAVSFSGTRPNEVIDEMMAYSASSRVWKGNRSTVIDTVNDEGMPIRVSINAAQWRVTAQQRIARAANQGGDQAVANVIEQLQEELVSGIINKYGVAENDARKVMASLTAARSEAQKAMSENGMFWDETRSARVIIDNGTRRMLTDNMILIDLKRLDQFLRNEGTTQFATNGKPFARLMNGANRLNETVLKWFRTAQLVKPGYIPKNSVAEPALASLLSHGTIIAPDGLASVVGHFFQNWGRRAAQVGLKGKDVVWRGAGSTARMNKNLQQLHVQRMGLRDQIEKQTSFIDTLDSAGTSPSKRAKNLDIAIEERRQLSDELKAVEAQIDSIDPIWREVEPVPSYHDLSTKINLIDQAISATPEYIDSLRAKIPVIQSRASARTSKEVSKLNTQVNDLIESSKSLELEISKVDDSIKLGKQELKSGNFTQEEISNLEIIRDALVRKQANNARRIDAINTRAAKLVDENGIIKINYSPSELESLASHRLQIGVYEKVAAGDTSISEELVNLRALQNTLREKIQEASMSSMDVRLDLLEQLKDTEKRIAGLQPKIASREARREAARDRVFGGEKPFYIDLDGEVVIAQGAFDQSQFGAAARAEASANLTTKLTLNPGNTGRLSTSRWQRIGDDDVIQPSDPGYWDELTHIANQQIRNDDFAKLVLSGADNQQLYHWLTETESGKRYADAMGWSVRDMQFQVTGSRKLKPMAKVDESGSRGSNDVKGNPTQPAAPKPTGKNIGDTENPNAPISFKPMPKIDEGGELKGFNSGKEVPDVPKNAGPVEVPEFVDSLISQNRQAILSYFPTPEVRKLVLGGKDVNPSQLRKLLGEKTDLVPVHSGTLQFNSTGFGNAMNMYNNALDAIWRGLMANPESRMFRWPWTQRQFQANMQSDLRLLQEQGIPITADVVNNARPNAMARAVKEAEQTFYNIRRVSNPVYAMRWFTYFPAAYFNSMYRYARLAYRNPGRTYLMSHAWTATYNAFGVDKNGDPVKNWRDTEAIVFRVPEGLFKKLNLPVDNKIVLSTRSWEFATQEPSATMYATIPVTALIKANPDLNPWFKQNLPADTYNFLFPLGQPQTNFAGALGFDSLVPSYLSDMKRMIGMQDEDSYKVAAQIQQYRLFEWQKNGQKGPPPDPMKAQEEAANFFKLRFATKFLWSGGVGTSPLGQFYRDETRRIEQAYPNDIVKQTQVFIDLHGVPGDAFFVSTSKNRAGIPYTLSAYNRLQSNEELTKKLMSLNPDNPQDAVSLMFGGTDGEFDSAVYNNLYENSLPGETASIRSQRTPQEVTTAFLKQQSWNSYLASKSIVDAIAKQYGYRSLSPTGSSAWLYQQWHAWLDPFKQEPMNAAWLADFSAPDNGRADRLILGLRYIVNDKNFMQNSTSDPTYKIVQDYLTNLDIVRAAYDSVDTTEQKISIATQWQDYVENNFLSASSSMNNWYTRYFNDGRDLAGGSRVFNSD